MRVRLLGGFEVWCGDRPVSGFESQKVRALLAYLISNRQRGFSRDHLAGLLWPERAPDSARHALRQALYDLRSKLPGGDSPKRPILSSTQEVRFNPESDCWFDVEVFEEAVRNGRGGKRADPHQLVAAIQLYRGEFLAGFGITDSEGFEDWLVTEQERLREAAVEGLRALVESYRGRGEYRLGIHYGRRLVALDPLSEEAHRDLMRLFALAGRRGQALSVYEELRARLRRELDVEPLEETRALYETILLERPEESVSPEDSEPVGPLIPLVGRREAYVVLEECWQRVLGGTGQITFVEGEAGAGKSRLVKSFLDAATARRQTTVLKGVCYEPGPPGSYAPLCEALRGLLAEEGTAERLLSSSSPAELPDLARLVPELRELFPELPSVPPIAGPGGRDCVFAAVTNLLESLCRDDQGGLRPLVLFLDDVHLADGDTVDLAVHLARQAAELPLWIIAVYRSAVLEPDHPLLALARDQEAVWLGIGRLDTEDLEEIAQSLVGEEQAMELARFLEENGGGLPLVVAELINTLWDEGVLVARDVRSWRLASPLDAVQLSESEGEEATALILRRLRRLPNSTRRLAALAAVIGQHFEADLLQRAAEEHPGVVEIGLEILLKRWLVRQYVPQWASGRRERDIVLWTRGARRGTFEFAHRHVRNALYQDLNPLRRQAMHGQVAAALEEGPPERRERLCEALAFHYRAAGEWGKALPYLEQAAEKAHALAARGVALHYCDLALEALNRLVAGARNDDQADRWVEERVRLRELRERIAAE